MRILLLGCGLMGRAVAFDLARLPDVEELVLADVDERKVTELLEFIASERVSTRVVDVRWRDELTALLEKAEVAVGAVSYHYNQELTRLAIETSTHFVDMGGNNAVVLAQLALSDSAKAGGVTVVPDCGLAPGMVSVLVADAFMRFDSVDEVYIRVGGLPKRPQPPLDYMLVFSVQGLINEYVEPCIAVRGGQTVTLKPLEDVEEIEFPQPFGVLEAFNTSGGVSTLPETYAGRVREMNEKTIRYPGHARIMQAFYKLGFFNSTPVEVGGQWVSPRELTARLFYNNIPHGEEDVVLLRVTAKGNVGGVEKTLVYQMIDYMDETTALTAMMRTTGFPVAIVAHMLGSGIIKERGVLPVELVVPPDKFITELENRGMELTMRWED